MPISVSEVPVCALCSLDRVTLVVKRRPIDDLPWWVQYLLRWVYTRYGFACSDSENAGSYSSIEYQGVYADPAAAWFAAQGKGYSLTELPLNALLPDETCQFKRHDFPHTATRKIYQTRKLSTIAIPREQIERLDAKLETLIT